MYSVFLLKSLLAVLLVSTSRFLGTRGTRHLSPHARWNGHLDAQGNPIRVGPPNPAPTCLGIYGKPLSIDCDGARTRMREVITRRPPSRPPLNAQQREDYERLLIEFYREGSSPRHQNQLALRQSELPAYYHFRQSRQILPLISSSPVHYSFLYPVYTGV